MTADREQIRRDADSFIRYSAEVTQQRNRQAERFAGFCLALLAELEQVPALVEALERIGNADIQSWQATIADEALTAWHADGGAGSDRR